MVSRDIKKPGKNPRSSVGVRWLAPLALCALLACRPALANSDPLSGLIASTGGAGLGLALRAENSLYRGGGTRNDLVPLYVYEGKYLYLHAYRVGLKIDSADGWRFGTFLSHRFEGFPYDRVPAG